MDLKKRILSYLGLADIHKRLDNVEQQQEKLQDLDNRLVELEDNQEDTLNRIKQVEETQQELTDLKDTLTDKLIEGRPQIKYTLSLLESKEYSKKELVQELQDTFDISQTTAYRRINDLEEDLQYIEKTENGYRSLVDL
jgi:DNA repair exonuclease SbcCD ATPase subunit